MACPSPAGSSVQDIFFGEAGGNHLLFHLSSGAFAFLAVVLLIAGHPTPAAAQAEADTLRLEEAVQQALSQNYSARRAQTEAEVAGNNYARGNAGFLPQLNVRAQQNRRPTGSFFGGGDDSPTGGLGRGSMLGTFDASVNMNWPVFDGMRRFAVYDQLEAERDEAALLAGSTEENVLAEAIIRYYAVARQQQQVEVMEEAVGISEERLRIAELRRDLGSASELDVRQARIDLNEDRSALLEQESALTDARVALNQLMGRSGPASFRVSEQIDLETEFDLDRLSEEALQQNRTLRAERSARTVAELERRVVRAERLPRVDLTAGYAFNDFASEVGMPTLQPGGFSYGLTLTLDLFEGFNRRRRLENAQLRLQSQELAVSELEVELQSTLQSALEAYENSRQRAELEAENLEDARLNVDIALERFRLGTITSVELREVQRTLTRIENRLLTARFEAKEAETTLLRLSGRLLGDWGAQR